jgi:uncharacterized protein (TIGR02391 family)
MEDNTMTADFEKILHPRVLRHCKQLFSDGHYQHASAESMKQVELALKEKSGLKHKYGVRLTRSLFGKGEGIKLIVPFGEELQKQAEALFSGSFSYYRNYAVHDGSKIDETICMRILIIASELLDLIGASDISFADTGGVAGLIDTGRFQSKTHLYELLKYLDGVILPDHVSDGMYEDLSYMGLSEVDVIAVTNMGLVEYISEPYIPSELDKGDAVMPPDELGEFKLTTIGKAVLNDMKK